MSTPSAAQLDIANYRRPPRGESLDARWSRWLTEHPTALREFASIGRELLAAGETRLSAKFIVEIARYRQIIRRSPGSRYAVNNSFTSRLSRALEAAWPEFKDCFETRALVDERGDA